MTYVDPAIRADPKALAEHQRSILAALTQSLNEPAIKPAAAPVHETESCFCGQPAAKVMISDDALDELLLCQNCFTTLSMGYALRASFSDIVQPIGENS